MVTGFPSSSPYLPPCTIHFSPFATPALTLLFLLILLFLSFLPSSSPFYLPPPVSGLPLVPQALYNSINTKVKKATDLWSMTYIQSCIYFLNSLPISFLICCFCWFISFPSNQRFVPISHLWNHSKATPDELPSHFPAPLTRWGKLPWHHPELIRQV